MDKAAVSSGDLLKWMLGSALVGAGAKGLIHTGRGVFSTPKDKLFSETYSPEVPVDVEMSPEEYEEYQRLREKRFGKAASIWDPTIYAAGGALAGVGGWMGMKTLLGKMRGRKLDRRLEELRAELDSLSGSAIPEQGDMEDEDYEKISAAWKWLDEAAEDRMEKKAFLPKAVASSKWAVPALVGAAAAKPLLVPNRVLDATGGAITGTAGSIAGGVSRPVFGTLAKILGPISALLLLYGANRGWQASRERSPDRRKIKGMVAKMRDMEADASPHFVPRPVVRGRAESGEEPRREPEYLGLTDAYTEAEEPEEEEVKVASALTSAGVDAFNYGFFSKLAEYGYTTEEMAEISEKVGSHLSVRSEKTASDTGEPLIDFVFDQAGFVKEAAGWGALASKAMPTFTRWGKKLLGRNFHQKGPVFRKVVTPTRPRAAIKRYADSADKRLSPKQWAAKILEVRRQHPEEEWWKTMVRFQLQQVARAKQQLHQKGPVLRRVMALKRAPAKAQRYADKAMPTFARWGKPGATAPTPPGQQTSGWLAPEAPTLPGQQGPGMFAGAGQWMQNHPMAAQAMMSGGLGLAGGYLGSRMGRGGQREEPQLQPPRRPPRGAFFFQPQDPWGVWR